MNATRFNAPRIAAPPFARLAVRSALVLAFAALYVPSAAAAPLLGTAQSFAVLGSETVTNTGPTTVRGDLGVHAGPSVTGFAVPPANTVVEGPGSTGLIAGPGVVSGTIFISHDTAQQAKIDALTARDVLAALPFTTQYLIPTDLGGSTLTPGVYKFASSAAVTGALTLDFQGDPDALFVFQIASTLTTAAASSVNVVNGGADNGVFWQVGTSAILGAATVFAGNIIATVSITGITDATILCGRAHALTGAVTLDTNEVSADCADIADFGSNGFSGGFESFADVNNPGGIIFRPLDLADAAAPAPSTLALLGLGLAGLIGVGRRRKASALRRPSGQVTRRLL